MSGLEEEIKKVKFIFFEHHYDDMYKKNYKYSDVSNLLKKNNFKILHKNKMPFRKHLNIFGLITKIFNLNNS